MKLKLFPFNKNKIYSQKINIYKKMRKLIKKILRESDDLDWIRDTCPINYEYLLGKGLHFQPLIDNGRDLERWF
jgi:hypothetical protein